MLVTLSQSFHVHDITAPSVQSCPVFFTSLRYVNTTNDMFCALLKDIIAISRSVYQVCINISCLDLELPSGLGD